jgi:hypothetical protein
VVAAAFLLQSFAPAGAEARLELSGTCTRCRAERG